MIHKSTFKIILLNLLFFVQVTVTWSQFNFEFDPSVTVKKSGNTLLNPFAGGLNYIQIADFDYDFDGDKDLFLFDRSKNNIRVFTQELINGSPQWVYTHRAKDKFPSGIIYRATLVDYNMDGQPDLWTYGIGGLKVYKNIGNSIDGLQWELVKEIVESDYNGFTTNLYVASSDIPAIVDVDFDGDLDVLTFHIGGQHVEYHKNLSIETYGHADSLIFQLKNECWGKFSENISNNSVTLNDPNAPCVGGSVTNPEKSSEPTRHAGSTLLALDYDNSGVMDLILGDVSFTNLNLLLNGGTAPNTDSPIISADPFFPSTSIPVDLYLFPAAFYVDVDFDNVKDLIIGANAKNISENETSIVFYKNAGSNTLPNFQYDSKNFLQKSMIEHGTGSIPIIEDIDGDGLKDLVISNFYRYESSNSKESTIAWYKNTGTNNAPEYSFIDYDYLNLSQSNFGLRLVPTFGDFDNDGDRDLFLGNEFGKLIYLERQGSSFLPAIVDYQDNSSTAISVGSFSFPQLFDLDNDGLLDLVIGNKTGELAYYRNIGTLTNPSFQLINSTLGNVDVSGATPDGYAAPHFMRINNETLLFVGAIDGLLHYYNGIDNNLQPGSFFNQENPALLNLNVEAYSSFWVEDIDNDGFLNMFVGQDLGGIHHYEVDPNSTASTSDFLNEPILTVSPNPTADQVSIQAGNNTIKAIRILGIDGSNHGTYLLPKSNQVSVEHLADGVYLFEIELTNNTKSIKRIVVQH